jgi:HSP20 family protein
MSTLFKMHETTLPGEWFDPFDILFRDYFKTDQTFVPANSTKGSHPVDIYETPEGLTFEIACTGLSKSDVKVELEGDILKVSYSKEKEDDAKHTYIRRGISKRSFNLGYRVASRFDLSKSEAVMDNGLLTISVPFADQSKPKALKIK